MAYIVVQTQGKESHRVELKDSVTLGRSIKCNLWINDPALSREHCRFEREGETWYVVDLDSRNGTYVEGNKIERFLLGDKDTVKIGGAKIQFRDGIVRPERAPDPGQDHLVRLMLGELDEKNGVKPPDQPRPMPKAVPRVRPAAAQNGDGQPSSGGEEKWNNGANSLAFQRPRATPIVRPQTPQPRPENPE